MGTFNRCYFCENFLSDEGTPDPDHPTYRVCERKTCTRQRARLEPAKRLAKYEAVHQEWLRILAERQNASRLRDRSDARDGYASELQNNRVEQYGLEAVEFANKLSEGWVCPCKDHNVSQAGEDAVRDAALVASLTESDIDELVRIQTLNRNAAELLQLRRKYTWREWNKSAHSNLKPFFFGAHLGKMSLAHAEVRRLVAAEHDVLWFEEDLGEHGVQSWFVCSDWDRLQPLKVLSAVEIADTKPIPARRCDSCTKDAGLDYTCRTLKLGRGRYVDFYLCTRPVCVASREKVEASKYWTGIEALLRNGRQRNERIKKHHFYPAPGPLPESSFHHEADDTLTIKEVSYLLDTLASYAKPSKYTSDGELVRKREEQASYESFAETLRAKLARAKSRAQLGT